MNPTITNPTGNSRSLKSQNRLLVREIIRKHGPIARSQVAKLSGLAPPTVTVIVNEFFQAGILREIGHGESTANGGRRPVMLELNARAAFAVAVRIQLGEVVVALLDLAARILARRTARLDTSRPVAVVAAVQETFGEILKETGVKRDKVLWCGVASPGLVDSNRMVAVSANLGWGRVPLADLLSEALSGMPVHVENIANAAAYGEMEFGQGRGSGNIICVNLSYGIGAGIVIGGELYRGTSGFAGEVGHMILDPLGGPKCVCGGYGCFEAICGLQAVCALVQARVPAEKLARYGKTQGNLPIDEILAPPLAGLPEVQEILHRTGRLVGAVMVSLIRAFNPDTVILSGELVKTGDAILNAVIREVEARIPERAWGSVRIVKSDMMEDPRLMGVYALVLEKIFQMHAWTRQA